MTSIQKIIGIILFLALPLLARGEMHEFFQKLSNEQIKQIKKIRKESKQEIKILREQMKKCRKELKTALEANVLDKANINRILEKSSSIRLKIEKKRIGQLISMLKVLTPDQRKMFRDIQKKRKRNKPRRFR